MSCRDEYAIQAISQAFRDLTCSDQTVSEIAIYSLKKAVYKSHKKKKLEITLIEALDWLNQGDSENGIHVWWTKIRSTIRYLDKKCDIGLLFKVIKNEICLQLNFNDKHFIICPAAASVISKKLHEVIGIHYYNTWTQQKMGGYSATSLSMCPTSNRILHNGEISVDDWKFIHSARTNSLPVNDRLSKSEAERKCRLCKLTTETQMHIFLWCDFHRNFLINRHNSALDLIFSAIIFEKPFYDVLKDSSCNLSSTNLRVDLQIKNPYKKIIWLVDIKIPYDVINRMDGIREENEVYYNNLKDEIQANLPNFKVHLKTIVIGCLGSWSPENDQVLREIGLSKNAIKTLTVDCIKSSIKWSNKNWKAHNTSFMDEIHNGTLPRKQ